MLRTLGTRPWFGRSMLVSGANKVFDGEGRLTDEKLRERIAAFIAGFAEFASKSR